MRQIIGRQERELSAADFARLRDRYDGVLLDVGTGDGRRVRHLARH